MLARGPRQAAPIGGASGAIDVLTTPSVVSAHDGIVAGSSGYGDGLDHRVDNEVEVVTVRSEDELKLVGAAGAETAGAAAISIAVGAAAVKSVEFAETLAGKAKCPVAWGFSDPSKLWGSPVNSSKW